MQQNRYLTVISDFPEYETCLKDYVIKTYKDKKIEFILRMLKRLDYLAKVEDEVLYDIMFNLESHFIEKDSTILNDKEEELSLTFVEQGQIDVYTKFEGSDFIIDKLHKGSAINPKVCFTQDPLLLNFRCVTDVKLLILPHKKMTELVEKYENKPFGRELLILQN